MPLEGARAMQSHHALPGTADVRRQLNTLHQATHLLVVPLSSAYSGQNEHFISASSMLVSSFNTSIKSIKVNPWVMAHVTKAQRSGEGPQMASWYSTSDYLFI